MRKLLNKYRALIAASIAFASLGLVVGCDVVDITPKSLFTDDNFWQNRAHADGAVVGIYDAMQGLGDDYLAYGEARGDLLQPGWGSFCCGAFDSKENFGKLQRNDITDANIYADWANFYDVINRANLVIKKVPDIVNIDPEFQQLDADYIVGEARFLRALAYWWMARVWKDVPLITEPTTSETDLMVRRTKQATVLQFVENELSDIVANSMLRPLSPGRGRASINAARALYAQVSLWNNNYDEVITQTTEIIEEGGFSLVGGENWFSLFNPGETSESIFELVYDASQNDRNGDTYGLSDLVSMVPSSYLRDLHEMPNQPSLRDNARGNGRTWVWTNAYFWKWIGRGPAPVPDNRISSPYYDNSKRMEQDPNFIFFRLADVYLMRAEAYNRDNQKDEAIADLNFIRSRAGVPAAVIVGTNTTLTSSATTEQIEDAIIEERARELAGEGHRWFDLMRIAFRRNNLDYLPNMVNNGNKYIHEGDWQAWPANPEARNNKFSNDPNTWYLPVYRDNKIENPRLTEPPID